MFQNFHGNVLVGIIVLVAALSMRAFTHHKTKNSWTKEKLVQKLSELRVPHQAWDKGAFAELFRNLRENTMTLSGKKIVYSTILVRFPNEAGLEIPDVEELLTPIDNLEIRAKHIACEALGKTEGFEVYFIEKVDHGTHPSGRYLGLSTSWVKHAFMCCAVTKKTALQEARA